MSAAFQDEFSHFAGLMDEHRAIAERTIVEVRARMTDQALADLVKAGIVKATDDKERATSIVSGIIAAAKIALPLLGII